MRELHAEAAERLNEGDRAFDVEVGALALKLRVCGLLQHENDVSRNPRGNLVRLLVESELVPIRRTLGHDHLHHLLHLLRLVLRPLPVARAAPLLHLLNHRPHAHHSDVDALPAALGASGHGPGLDHLAAHPKLARFAHVDLLKGDSQLVHYVLSLPHTLRLPLLASAAREHIEQIGRAAAAAAAATKASRRKGAGEGARGEREG
mmetsp:Transcript_9268/g.22320  ORF Transcript_9268/g.22320 Transcript_9268/m.22320 type:complete len:205 (-) Transcript_9268:1143-1757(-)